MELLIWRSRQRFTPSARSGRTDTRKLLATCYSLLATALIAGCASAPLEAPFVPPVFPPSPDEPRFVYERTLRINEDVERPEGLQKLKLFAVGAPDEAKGLVKPFDVAVRRGRVYVTDTVQRVVCVFDIAQGHYYEFGSEEPGRLQQPMGIDISPQGEVYVVDGGAHHVSVYNPDGKYLRQVGGPDSLTHPSGVALSPDGNKLYVVDTAGVESVDHRVQVYDTTSGKLVQTIGKRGTEPGEFNFPILAATAPDGTLYVVDKGNFRIQVFAPDGSLRGSFGTLGRNPGQFASPKGIATDVQGNVYVVDSAFGNVQIFNPQGQLLMFMGRRGQSGAPANFMLPAGIAVDENGRVYMTDQFFRKVDIFRPAVLAPHEGYAASEPPPK